jgi:cell wall-associated NlpC family hydrolase
MSNWIENYLGDEWRASDHDCWGFFRRVQAEQFKRELPVIEPSNYGVRTLIRTYSDHAERARWHPVDYAMEGDGVLMGKARRPTHVGVWVEADGGGVLHCQENSGVIFTSHRALARLGWNVLGLYRYEGQA